MRDETLVAFEAHATADELALFVLDALEPPVRRQLERHVATCAACARGLAAEAAAEVALQAAWPQVPRPLAPVLSLPVRPANVADVPAVPIAAAAPVAGQQARKARPAATSRVLASGSWGNGVAAAVLTVLFVGFWKDGPAPRSAGPTRPDGALTSEALCTLDVFTPAPLILATSEPPARMCPAPEVAAGGLCQEPTATCAP
jgi:hypothetical protein